MDSELSEIYNQTDNPAAVETEESAAVIEDTAAEPDEAAADTTTEETTAEDTDETTEVDETDDSAVSTDGTESDDDFRDLLEDIPSNETLEPILKRTPQAVKDEAYRLRDGWAATHEIVQSIGGEEGAKLLQPIATAINTPVENFTSELAAEAIGSLVMSNGAVAAKILAEGAQNLLFNTIDEPMWREAAKIGDRVLEQRFEKDAAWIDKVVLLAKEGYFDPEADFETLKLTGADSNVFQVLQTESKEKDTEIARLKELVENPHLITTESKQSQNAVTEMELDLKTRIEEAITPFKVRGQWDAATELSQTALDAVMAGIRETSEYKDALALVRQYKTFKSGDGSLPFPLQGKLLTLTNKAKARFSEKVSAINKELKTRSVSSVNKDVQEKTKEVKPKAVPTVPNNSRWGGAIPIPDGLEEIYRETDMLRA